jgi:hypothetical protein
VWRCAVAHVSSSLVDVRALPFANKETIQTFQLEKVRWTRHSVHNTKQYVNQWRKAVCIPNADCSMHVADVHFCSFAYCCYFSLLEETFLWCATWDSETYFVFFLLYVPPASCMGLQYRISY